MFEHMLMPLNRQYDDGFGVVADSFKDAAEALAETHKERKIGFGHIHLPINFLYRHSIELFLKSMVIILHRKLNLVDLDGNHHPYPKIPVGKKLKDLHNTHDIGALYGIFRAITTAYADDLSKLTSFKFADVPPELDAWVVTIATADSSSTFFRYPTSLDKSADAAKAGFKQTTEEKIIEHCSSEERPAGFFFVLKNDEDEVVESYELDRDPMPELHEALKNASEMLMGAHCAMRAQLTCGF